MKLMVFLIILMINGMSAFGEGLTQDVPDSVLFVVAGEVFSVAEFVVDELNEVAFLNGCPVVHGKIVGVDEELASDILERNPAFQVFGDVAKKPVEVLESFDQAVEDFSSFCRGEAFLQASKNDKEAMVERYLGRAKLGGAIESWMVDDLGAVYLTFLECKGPYVIINGREMSGPVSMVEKGFLEKADEFWKMISSKLSGEDPRLTVVIISVKGGYSFGYGKSTYDRTTEQISEMKKSGGYVEGPIPKNWLPSN